MRWLWSSLLLLAIIAAVLSGKDYYAILGVSRDASSSQIRKAYRQLSLKWHPDKNKGNSDAEAKFVEISTAYDVLVDDEKRRIYDQHGEEGLQQGGRNAGFRSPFDIFSNFGFGGFDGGHQHEQKKGPSVEIPLEVTLQDLYLGKELKVGHRKQVLCPKCRGTGAKDAHDVQTCPECKGSGTKVYTQQLGPGFITQTQRTCDKCGGKGKIVKSTCPHCRGAKVDVADESITVIIERGMADRQTLVFEQEADEAPDTTPGDVIFRLVTLPHKRFRRDGNNLQTRMNVTLLEALVGFSKTIKHLDGHDVSISKTEVTRPGEVLEIEDEGMPHHQYPSQTGHLYVEFAVVMPASVTEEQKAAFKKLLS